MTTSTQTFASLVPKINPSVTGCPYPTIVNQIRDTAIRVCERTLAWRYEVPKFDLLPGVHEYAFNCPADTQVHAIFGTTMNGAPLEILTLEQAIAKYPAWADLYSGETAETLWSLTPPITFNSSEFNEDVFNPGEEFATPDSVVADGGEPRSITQVRSDRFVVLPLPDASTYTIRMFVALKPARTAEGMDAHYLSELEDTIIHGTLQHLMLQPNTNWADRELAAYHARQYLFHLTERRARANLGATRGMLRAQFPAFS